MRTWDELLDVLVGGELIFFEVKIVKLEVLTLCTFAAGYNTQCASGLAAVCLCECVSESVYANFSRFL
jgi:hypothetical protein